MMLEVKDFDSLYCLIEELRARGVTSFRCEGLELDILPAREQLFDDASFEEEPLSTVDIFGPREVKDA